MNLQEIQLSQYQYELPANRIAQFPLEQRDHSKLLHYSDGNIRHKHFYNLPKLLPKNSLLVYNNTKVIPARCYFQRKSGAWIEVFLLDPITPSNVMEEVMTETKQCSWKCMIGNLKKWKSNEVLELQLGASVISASLLDREDRIVQFAWDSGQSFSEILHAIGKLPLPPYIKREAEDADQDHYQTIYAKQEGAVAAPTAGLHFTDRVMGDLRNNGIERKEITLHVGAGTFQPVTANHAVDHDMHSERFELSKTCLQDLIANKDRTLVGTTSLRTMESLYWMGLKELKGLPKVNQLGKLEAYELSENSQLPSYEESLQALLNRSDVQELGYFRGETAIYIMPGYRIRSCKRLITNFHMPETTLILLVAAYIGEDWRKVYDAALKENYRFLSYGDSSLLELKAMDS